MTTEPLLKIENLHTHFNTSAGVVNVVNGFDLTVMRGEVIGLVGESGAGKSVVAYSILGMPRKPGRIVDGRVIFDGRDLLKLKPDEIEKVRGGEISLIVSNPKPKLNPLVKVGNQIASVYRAHRNVSKQEALERSVEMLKAVGLNDPERRMNSHPHELSGGMAQRILIAMALICEPKLLIADDPTYGLDVTIQVQVLDLIRDLIRSNNSSAILITHDLSVVAQYCDRIAIIYAGRVVEQAPVKEFFASPKHPYSLSLLGSIRASTREHIRLPMLGVPPDLRNLPSACHLHPRCPIAQDNCSETDPPIVQISDDHFSRCHFADKITQEMIRDTISVSQESG